MKGRRTKHGPAFEAKLALAAIREEVTVAALSRRHKIHANQIYKWKRRALKNLERVFEAGMRVIGAANEQVSVQHPEVPMSNCINIVTAVAASNEPERTHRRDGAPARPRGCRARGHELGAHHRLSSVRSRPTRPSANGVPGGAGLSERRAIR